MKYLDFLKHVLLKDGGFYAIMFALPFVVPLLLVESYLRLTGTYDTYAEKTGNSYRSYYNQEPPSIYWNYPKNTTYTIDQVDFSYDYQTNEIGLREKKDAVSNHDTSAFRILTLGDSFTEGFGAPTDSAWPRALESPELIANLTGGKRVSVYNAGMAGSDPFFNFVMLRDKLLSFKPDLVIQCINTSDLTDYLFRGGIDRFSGDRVFFRKGPWWELLYRFSYVFRLVMHSVFEYDFMLIDNGKRVELYDRAVEDYLSLFTEQLAETAIESDFSVAYVIQPMSSDLRFVGNEYKRLMKLDTLLRKEGFVSFDLLKPMRTSIGYDSTYYYSWQLDGHYNSKGYWIMGNIVGDSLNRINCFSKRF